MQERSLLALSAGLGEEVLFRGFMQASVASQLSNVSIHMYTCQIPSSTIPAPIAVTVVRANSRWPHLPRSMFVQGCCTEGNAETLNECLIAPQLGEVGAQSAAVGVTSVVFGALHAITPLYFFWATAGGALFGAEYVVAGLAAAVFTHWAYDWLAFEVSVWLAERRTERPPEKHRG